MTITLGDGPTHPTPSHPKPGPPPPDPPRRPVEPPSRGDVVLYAHLPYRVDAVHMSNATCRYCSKVHDDYALGAPGHWVTRAPGCLVVAS